MPTCDGATKFDDGKPRWDLAPMKEMQKIIEVLTFGAHKYEDNGWKGVDKKRYVAALLRHMTDYMDGNNIDDDSGLEHMAHVACNALFIMWKDSNDKNCTD